MDSAGHDIPVLAFARLTATFPGRHLLLTSSKTLVHSK